MTRPCDVCKQPSAYRYRHQWNCKECYGRRRAIFSAFYATCRTPGVCSRGSLPRACHICDWNIEQFRQKEESAN